MHRLGPLLCLGLLLIACDSGVDASETLTVDLGGGYDDTFVLIDVDDEQVFSGTVTTGAAIASAGTFSVAVRPGEHRVSVTVEGRVSGALTVHTDTTVTVSASYDRETQVVSLHAWSFPIPHR